MRRKYIVFDFDSTIVKNEVLNDIVKTKVTDPKIKQQIDDICNKALNGEISFNESITTRFNLANLTSNDFKNAAANITNMLTDHIESLFYYINFAIKHINEKKIINVTLMIVSAGFKEVIMPIANKLKINKKYVFANEYKEKKHKLYLKNSPLLYDDGKCKILKKFAKKGPILMIGDGMSDYDVYKNYIATMFCGFGLNKVNKNVKQNCLNDKTGNAIFIEKNWGALSKQIYVDFLHYFTLEEWKWICKMESAKD